MAPHSPYDPLYLVPKAVDRPWTPKFDSRGAFLVVHVNCGIFVWLGKLCEQVMADSANSAARQVIRYENMKVSVETVREGLESVEFWNVLTEDDWRPEDDLLVAGEKRVELYDLDFEIFKRALKGNDTLKGNEVKESRGWSRVRKKFMLGREAPIAEENEEEEEEEEGESQFHSPGSLSGESSITSGDTASTLSTFSPASSSSSDWHTPSPSSSDLLVGPFPMTLQPPVLVSKLPPLYSRKVKKSQEEKDSLCTAISQSLAERRGNMPPSLALLPLVEGGESRLSPRDLVRDWCLSPAFVPDIEEHRIATMDTVQPTTSGHNVDDEQEKISNRNDDNDHIWPANPILFRWPSMEKVEEISPRSLDSNSVFMLLVPPNSSPGKPKADANILYVWLGRHSQVSKELADDRQIVLDRIRVNLIDRMALPLDVPAQVTLISY